MALSAKESFKAALPAYMLAYLIVRFVMFFVPDQSEQNKHRKKDEIK